PSPKRPFPPRPPRPARRGSKDVSGTPAAMGSGLCRPVFLATSSSPRLPFRIVMPADTIIALSTPPGTSGLAVVRLSGPGCADVARVFLGRTTWTPRMLHVAAFRDPAEGAEAEPLDRLAFHLLPGPASPTGEDVLELFPHGNPLLVE